MVNFGGSGNFESSSRELRAANDNDRISEEPVLKPIFTELSFEEFENGDLSKIHETWRKNHALLKARVARGPFHFFGLHGTPKSSHDVLITGEHNPRLELATFYDRDNSEKFVYQLYAAALYTSAYTTDRNYVPRGGILVFDLQKEKRNCTHPWEHLLGGGLFGSISFDSSKERGLLAALDDSHNLLFRTTYDFPYPNEFKERLRGSIDMAGDFEKYFKSLKPQDAMSSLARLYLRNRILAQAILEKVLDILEKN